MSHVYFYFCVSPGVFSRTYLDFFQVSPGFFSRTHLDFFQVLPGYDTVELAARAPPQLRQRAPGRIILFYESKKGEIRNIDDHYRNPNLTKII